MKQKITVTIQRIIDYVKSPRGESIRYLFIGGCTTLLDYATHYFMNIVLHIDFNISNFTSTSIAIIFAYITNKFIVFCNRTDNFHDLAVEFLKFIGSRLFTMGIEIGGGFLLVNVLGQNSLLGKAEAIIVVIIVNYFLSKFVVFRNKAKTQE